MGIIPRVQLKVLLVVSEESIRELLQRFLYSQGHIVIVAQWYPCVGWAEVEAPAHIRAVGEVAVRTYQNVFLPEEKSPIEKAIAYLHESRGEVDLVIGELFGTDGRSLAEVVAAIRQIDKSRGFPGCPPKVFALPGQYSGEVVRQLGREVGADAVLPDYRQLGSEKFLEVLNQLIIEHFERGFVRLRRT
jgi:hypothetical protein